MVIRKSQNKKIKNELNLKTKFNKYSFSNIITTEKDKILLLFEIDNDLSPCYIVFTSLHNFKKAF